jgi:RNA polymerase sigma factor (sigma-70 family)
MPSIIHEINIEEQLCRWIKEMRPDLIRMARRWRRPDPEDIVGTVEMKMWRNRHKTPPTFSRCWALAVVILRNTIIQEWRREQHLRRLLGDRVGEDWNSLDSLNLESRQSGVGTLWRLPKSVDARERAIRNEVRERLREILGEERFQVFDLYKATDMSSEEVGAILNVSADKVRRLAKQGCDILGIRL